MVPRPLWLRALHPWGWLLPLLAALFFFPQIDLQTSAAFYEGADKFPWRHSMLGDVVRNWVPRAIIGSLAICVVFWIVGLLQRRTIAGLTGRHIAYLLVTLLIGPGLIVETLLKPHWGRPRPEVLTDFGGTLLYAPPLLIAEGCARNCSFVSGHAAVAFWVTAYAFLLPAPYRRWAMAGGLMLGAAVGAMRVMQGAHFVSDVIYAGAIVVGVNVLVARYMLRPETAR